MNSLVHDWLQDAQKRYAECAECTECVVAASQTLREGAEAE